MPFVNLLTGKIYGCKKNSKAWFHEQGHILYNRKLPDYIYYREVCFFWLVASIAICMFLEYFVEQRLIKVFPFFILLTYLVLYFVEEGFAWIYALKQNWRLKNNG